MFVQLSAQMLLRNVPFLQLGNAHLCPLLSFHRAAVAANGAKYVPS